MTRAKKPSWVTLAPKEQVVWQGHPSHWVIAEQLIIGSIVVGIGVAGLILLPGLWIALPAALILGGGAYAGLVSFKHRQVKYLLTSTEIYKKSGVFSKSVINLRLDRIQNTSFTQSFTQRLLTYGTIQIETAGTEGTDLVIEAANDPEYVVGQITARLDTLKSTSHTDRSTTTTSMTGTE